MLDNVAALFGMGADDLVKIIGAIAMGIATLVGAAGKTIVTLHGARRRSFQKIRRLEDLAEILSKEKTDPEVLRLIAVMKTQQRDPADEKDADSE